jgi:hypothetical protein
MLRAEGDPELRWPYVAGLDPERLHAGFFCPQDEPLVAYRSAAPVATLLAARPPPHRWPPGESAGGGTQCTPPGARCAQHGYDSCVPRASRAVPSLQELCVRVVAQHDHVLGACPTPDCNAYPA